MSKFRALIEGILKEYYTKNGSYTNDPQDAYDGEDEYYEWLDDQDYREGYAVLLGQNEKGKDLFASADKSVPDSPDYIPTTDIYGYDLDSPDVFEYGRVDTEEEAKIHAENFAKEWKQVFPDSNPTVVKVYARDEDGYEFHRTKEEVYPWENWDYSKYLDDLRWSEADDKYDEMRERELFGED